MKEIVSQEYEQSLYLYSKIHIDMLNNLSYKLKIHLLPNAINFLILISWKRDFKQIRLINIGSLKENQSLLSIF